MTPARPRDSGLRVAGLLALLLAVATPLAHAAGDATDDRGDSWYLRTGGAGSPELYVHEFGARDGDPVVVLHGGWGAEHGYLIDVLRPLFMPARRFVFFDQRGSLRSPADPATLSVAQQVADIERLRVALQAERVTLLGHSMGTYLALAYLHAHPGRVSKLVLMGAMPARYEDTPGELAAMNRYAVEHLRSRPAVERELAMIDAHPSGNPDRDATARWRIRFAAVNLWHVERWRQMPGGRAFFDQRVADAIGPTMPHSIDFEPLLAAPTLATFVIGGDHDYADPGLAYWRGVADRIPGVSVTMIDEAGHSPWIDDPEAVERALRAALETPTPR